jgi:phosphoribosylformylglycinamidine synthase
MGDVRRIFVEKKEGYNVAAQGLLADLRGNLGIGGLKHVRVLIRYDIEGISEQEYQASRTTIFAEPPVDFVFDEIMPVSNDERGFAIE